MFEIHQPRQAGIFVRRARMAQGMTQRQLAEKAGVSERSVLSLEVGDATGIRLDKLLAILDALGACLAVPDTPEPDRQPTSTPSPCDSTNQGDVESTATPSEPAPPPHHAEDAHRPLIPHGLSNASYQQLFDDFVRRSRNGGAR